MDFPLQLLALVVVVANLHTQAVCLYLITTVVILNSLHIPPPPQYVPVADYFMFYLISKKRRKRILQRWCLFLRSYVFHVARTIYTFVHQRLIHFITH